MSKLKAASVDALKGTNRTLYEPVALGGSLVARGLASKVRYYYQYWHHGKKSRHPFGDHSAGGDGEGSAESTEYTLAGARARVVALAALQREHGDLIGYFADQREAAAELVETSRTARIERQHESRTYSLGRLCEAYGDHLVEQGKASAKSVQNALRRWVIDRHPVLVSKKASEVTTDDILTILRSVIDAGHTTMTNRLRSHLSAAYTFGIGSATDPLTNSKAQGFRLRVNPVVAIKPVQKFEAAGERALSAIELAEVVRRLEQLNTPAAKAVLLALRLGGQRITQLLALTRDRFDADMATVVLMDPKGRRNKPRSHLLPVVASALPLLEEALSVQHDRRPGLWAGLSIHTVSKLVAALSKDMVTDGVAPFTLRDLRRTCETRMAAMRISKDDRAQIQSHGLSGVQDRHYDKHDYLAEKKAALEAWNRKLDELAGGTGQSNVVEMVR